MGTEANDPAIPGKDPDPGARVEERLKVAWAIVGVFFTLGIFGYVLQRFGLTILKPPPRTLADYARLLAFIVACLNVGVWMWFPLEDLQILRQWVRTSRKIFPVNVAEFFAMILATTLILLLVIGALVGPIWFGVAGMAVYSCDLFGFRYIRKHVREALRESRDLYGREEPAIREPLLRAADAIQEHWACESHYLIQCRRQRRSLVLILCFATVTIIATLSEGHPLRTAAAYLFGTATLVLSEVSIATWRYQRDCALLSVQEDLRIASEH